EAKATQRPLAESEGTKLPELPWAPTESTDTRTVCPVARSCTKTSRSPLVSPVTRLVAYEAKATQRPLAESEGTKLPELPWAPAESTATRTVPPACTAALLTTSTRLKVKSVKNGINPLPFWGFFVLMLGSSDHSW